MQQFVILMISFFVIFLFFTNLQSHAQVDDEKTPNYSGDTIFMESLADFMLEVGIGIDGQNEEGLTALMNAARSGNKEAVDLLIERGADINVQDNNGWTALLYALNENNKEIAELLIEKGADIHLKNEDGQTALFVALFRKSKEIAKTFN